MKKLLALLTALMLCMGCCASYAQSGHDREDYLGYWKLEELKLMGVTMSAESAGWNGFLSFREDDTVIFCMDDDDFSSSDVVYENGVARLTDANVEMPCVIGADGKIRCSTTFKEMPIEFVYVRTDYPALPAPMADWPGEYELVSVSMGGQSMPTSALSQYEMRIYEDGFGMFSLGKVKASFRMWEEDGAIRGIDKNDARFEAWINENGELCIRMIEEGLVIVGRRKTPAQQPVAETVVSAASDNPFLGEWQSVGVVLMGVELSLPDLGMEEMQLRIEPDMAYIRRGDSEGSCATRYEGDVLVFTNGTERIDCTVEDGWLYMSMNVDGVNLRVKMERVGAVPAAPASPVLPAETPAASVTTTSPFDGVWRPQAYLFMGVEMPAESVDLSVELVISGSAAMMDVSGEVVQCYVAYDGNTCTLYDDSESNIACVLGEDGRLSVELESDGLMMTMMMVRDGTAPEVEEPAAEEPVIEIPVVEEPAIEVPTAEDGFDGTWTLVQAVRDGEIVAAGQLGLTGSLVVTGSSARYTLGSESMLGLVSIDGTTLKLVGRSSYTFTLNAQGLLQMETTVDGETLTLRFSRGGMPVEEPVEEEPVIETPVVEEPVIEEPAIEVPTAEEGFDGTWTLVQAVRDGEIVAAGQLGLTGSLVVTGSSARYTLGSESMLGLVSIDGTTLKLVGRSSYTFTLNAQGLLQMETTVDGETLTLRFSRGGMPVEEPVEEEPVIETPVVEEPVVDEPEVEEPAGEETAGMASMLAELSGGMSLGGTLSDGNDFEGSWTLVQIGRQSGTVPAAQLGLSGSLVVSGHSAAYTLDAETMTGMITVDGMTMTMLARGGSMQFTLDEAGFLCRNTLMDGDVVELRFARGEAPASETIAALPAAEVVSGFEGCWRGDSAMVLGMSFTLSELDMSAIEVEITADGCFLTDKAGRRAVNAFRDGERLILTDGALRWVLLSDDQGQPLLEMTREEVVLEIPLTPAEGASRMQPAGVDTPEVTEKVCDFCRTLHDAAQSHTIGSMTICPDCFSRYFQ